MDQEFQKPSIFSPVSSAYFLITVIYTVFIGLIVAVLYQALWNPLEFNLADVFRRDFIFSIFIILIPALVFALVLHFGKRIAAIGVSIIFVVLAIAFTILGATIFSGEGGLGLIYLAQFVVMGSVGAGIVGWVARGFFKLSTFVVILMIILLPLALIGTTFFYVQSYQGTELTTQKCEALNNVAKIDCYNELARQENQWHICEKIEGADNVREGCVKAIWTKSEQQGQAIDHNQCSLLSDHSLILCYQDVALKKNDQSICNNIPDNKDPSRPYLPSDRENCINQVEQSGPAQVGDVMACLQNKAGGITDCISKVMEETGGDWSKCAALSNDGNLLRDNCYTYAARVRKDISICNKTAPNTHDYCVKQVQEAR